MAENPWGGRHDFERGRLHDDCWQLLPRIHPLCHPCRHTLIDVADPLAVRYDGDRVLAAARWMESRQSSVASSTFREEGYAWAALPSSFAKQPLSTIRTADLETLFGSMLSTRSRSTVSRLRNTLSSLFGWAVREKLLAKNSVTDSRVPKGTGQTVAREVWPFNLAKLRALTATIEAQHGKAHADISLTLGLSGLRWGELVALRVRDVQLVPYPAFRVSRSKPDNEPVRYVTKGGKSRTVPLAVELEAVRPMLAGRSPDAPLFASSTGGYLHVGSWKRAVGWKTISHGHRVHDLRHTAKTLWLQNGIDVKTAQAWLGHSTAKLTLDTYAHWLGTDADAAAIGRINAALRIEAGRAQIKTLESS